MRDALSDRYGKVRLAAASAVWNQSKDLDAVLPVLIEALNDADPEVREKAAKVLSQIALDAKEKIETILPVLLKALENDNFQVRQDIAVALTRIGPPAKAAIPALLRALRAHGHYQPAGMARTAPQLIEPFQQAYRATVGNAIETIGAGAGEWLPLFIEALHDPDPTVRQTAVAVLGKIGTGAAKAIPLLESMLVDPDPLLRVKAARALWRIDKRSEVIQMLIGELNGSGESASEAGAALAEMGPAAVTAFPSLQQTFQSQNLAPRLWAGLALWKMGQPAESLLSACVDALQSRDLNAIAPATVVLGQMGPDARAAVSDSILKHLEQTTAGMEDIYRAATELTAEDAVALWSEAIRNDPNDGQAYNLRGLAHLESDQLDRAMADFAEAIRQDADDPSAYESRGDLYARKAAYGLAIADYTQILRLDLKNAPVWSSRSLCHARTGNFDQAIADANEALRLDPKSENAYNHRAIAYKNQGDYDRAIADYTKAIELDPLNAGFYLNRSLVFSCRKDHQQAVANLHEALRIEPHSGDVYGQMAWVYATCADDSVRDGKKALEYATKACELSDWKNPAILDTLATVYAANGQYGEAVRWVEKALKHSEQLTRESLEEVREHLEMFQRGIAVRK